MRTDPPFTGDERATLTGFLAWQRQTLEMKCAGLDSAAMARRSVEPSDLSLLGLVRHLADVERAWFRRVLARRDDPPIFYSDADRDGDLHGAAPSAALVDEAWTAWRAEVAYAEELVAARELDSAGHDPRYGPVSVRWVLLHMIEEYARHIGHADLLRERIDGVVGE
jgi:uncharacterized damage-inducible protein DinB